MRRMLDSLQNPSSPDCRMQGYFLLDNLWSGKEHIIGAGDSRL